MKRVLLLLDSTIGQKIITAATGLALVGFVVGHLVGNLQMFAGEEAINIYAKKLKSLGPLLWVARVGLLVLITLHIAMTVRLYLRNRRAAGNAKRQVNRVASTRSSRNMIVSGSIILAFIIFHLMHFTFGWIQPDDYSLKDSAGRHDVYTMVVRGFENWGIALFYIVSMVTLMSHLSHASWSVLQTLGVTRLGAETKAKQFARAFAILTAIGFISIPLAVALGLLVAS